MKGRRGGGPRTAHSPLPALPPTMAYPAACAAANTAVHCVPPSTRMAGPGGSEPRPAHAAKRRITATPCEGKQPLLSVVGRPAPRISRHRCATRLQSVHPDEQPVGRRGAALVVVAAALDSHAQAMRRGEPESGRHVIRRRDGDAKGWHRCLQECASQAQCQTELTRERSPVNPT